LSGGSQTLGIGLEVGSDEYFDHAGRVASLTANRTDYLLITGQPIYSRHMCAFNVKVAKTHAYNLVAFLPTRSEAGAEKF